MHEDHNYFSPEPFEHFDAVTGNILLTFTDLVLPGNAGRDLRFQRVYNSFRSGDDLTRWRFGFPGMVMRIIERDQPWNGNFQFDDNISAIAGAGPTLVMADGRTHPTAYTSRYNRFLPSTYFNVRSGQFMEYDRLNRNLRMPDGIEAHYEPDGTLPMSGRPVLALRSFSDKFGNTVTLTPGPNNTLLVTQSVGSQTREVLFTMEDGMPTSMTYLDRTWQYTYVNSGSGTRDIETVTLPEGPGWTFTYDADLTDITVPTGGKIHYQYVNRWIYHSAHPGDDNYREEVHTIAQREARDGNTVLGTWTLAVGPSYTNLPTTSGTITTPSGVSVVYSSDGVPSASRGLEGGISTTSRTIYQGTTLVERDFRQFDIVKSIDYGGGVWFGSSELMRREVIRRDPITGTEHTYTTQYTYAADEFGDYHHPSKIFENNNYGLARSTCIDYRHFNTATLFQVGNPERERITFGTCTPHETTADPTAIERSWTYDSGNAFRLTETNYGIQTRFGIGDNGNIGSITDANDKTTLLDYTWGQVSSTHTPLYIVSRGINPDGTVASQTSAGRTTTFEYDKLGRIKRVHPPAGNDTVTTYNLAARTTTVTRGTSSVVTRLDAFGRSIETENSLQVKTRTEYDSEGRVRFQSLPFTSTPVGVTFDYDALDRVVLETHSDGAKRRRVYRTAIGSLDQVVVTEDVTSQTTRTTTYTRLPFGHPDDARLVAVHDAAGNDWSYTFDVAGNLRNVSGPDNISRTWVYNGKNLLQSETHPESGTVTYAYDDGGLLRQRTDAKNIAQVFAYDDNRRLTAVTSPGHSTTITYENGSDNRASTNVDGALSEFIYDAAGRLEYRINTIDGRELQSRFEYDGNDNLSEITYPSGRRIHLDYGNENRIQRVFNAATNATYASGFSYHASGALTGYTAGNGVPTTIAYDQNRYWITSLQVGSALQLGYADYDRLGNVKTITDSRANFTQIFTYDALDRLASANAPGSWSMPSITYDAHGNRSDSGFRYESGNRFRLRSTDADSSLLTYDANGNLEKYFANGNPQSTPQSEFTYTPNNLLATARVGSSNAAYAYDGDDWRLKKVVNGTTAYYMRGPNGQLLTEWEMATPNAKIRDYIYAGSRVLAVINTNVASAPTRGSGDRLLPGEALYPEQDRISHSGRYRLLYQNDGNLVLYDMQQGGVVWESQTSQTRASHAIMQLDGNFVIYDTAGVPCWSSGTVGIPGAYVVVHNGGFLEMYNPAGQPIWTSAVPNPPNSCEIVPPGPGADRLIAGERLDPEQDRVSQDNHYRLLYQRDGNLVLYDLRQNSAIWTSETSGTRASRAIMQGDGNFVIYDTSNVACWSSGTVGNPGAYLVVHTGGFLAIYRNGAALWTSAEPNPPNACQLAPPPPPPSAPDLLIPGEKLYPEQDRWSNDRRYRLLYQADGNLVLYDQEQFTVVWESQTSGVSAGFASMRGDGNFVLYDSNEQDYWNSGTQGNSGAYLAVNSGGFLVIYNANGTDIWTAP